MGIQHDQVNHQHDSRRTEDGDAPPCTPRTGTLFLHAAGTALRFMWAGDRMIEEITATSTPTLNAVWILGAEREPVRMTRSGTASYYRGDAAGSIEKLTNLSGSAVESVEYTAFAKPSITSSAVGNGYLAGGDWYDFALSMHVRGRPYDPGMTLRFVVAREGSDYSPLGQAPALREVARLVDIEKLPLPVSPPMPHFGGLVACCQVGVCCERAPRPPAPAPFVPCDCGGRIEWCPADDPCDSPACCGFSDPQRRLEPA